MLIIPAIDIYNSNCVRLSMGKFSEITEYESNPVLTAQRFYREGAKWIHIVDLNAAEGKGTTNRAIIRRIRDAVPCRIEIGGGIRKETDIKELLEIGVDRLILGTIAVTNPDLIKGWIDRYGNVFIAGIDAKNGLVRISGWQENTEIQDTELAGRLKKRGIKRIIYTNIAKDGLLKGPDIERTLLIAKTSGMPVVLSGGISSEEDIARIYRNTRQEDNGKEDTRQLSAGEVSSGITRGRITGIITGKALYEKRINLGKMIQMYENEDLSEEEW